MEHVHHAGPLFPPSAGLVTTRCGRRLPFTSEHFDILGDKLPEGSRLCKQCEMRQERRWRSLTKQGWFEGGKTYAQRVLVLDTRLFTSSMCRSVRKCRGSEP